MLFCRGEHLLTDFSKRDKVPKSDWAVKKRLNMYNENKNVITVDKEKDRNDNKYKEWYKYQFTFFK